MAFAHVHISDDEVDRAYRAARAEKRKRGAVVPLPEQVDPSDIVNGDPNFYYHGVNKRNKNRLAQYRKAGYTLADKEDWAVNVGLEPLKEDNGLKVLSEEQILVKIPREKKIQRMVAERMRYESDAQDAYEASKEKINKMYRDEMHGKPHTSVVVDETEEGPEQIERISRAKK